MTLARFRFSKSLGLAALAAAFLAAPLARADEYGDVSQLMRAGKLPEAQVKAELYLATKPKDPQMRFLKGVIQTETGRTQDAIGTFTKLTEDYPELPEPYNNLAVLHAGAGQFDKARAALEMAIRTNPSYATAHENLGDVYAKLASQAYSRALQLDATNTAVQPKLALIRELFSTSAKSGAAGARPAAATAAPSPLVTKTAAVAKTPVAAAASPAAAQAPADAGSRDVEAAVLAWASAWSSRDIGGYLGAYAREFEPPGAQSRSDWEEERRSRIVGKARIVVQLSDMSVSVNGNRAVARFKQSYSADALNVSSRKTLELQKAGDRWMIVRESTGA